MIFDFNPALCWVFIYGLLDEAIVCIMTLVFLFFLTGRSNNNMKGLKSSYLKMVESFQMLGIRKKWIS